MRTETREGWYNCKHTSVTQTDCLPSGLVVVPSSSKLKKNKERVNREVLVIPTEVGADIGYRSKQNKSVQLKKLKEKRKFS